MQKATIRDSIKLILTLYLTCVWSGVEARARFILCKPLSDTIFSDLITNPKKNPNLLTI